MTDLDLKQALAPLFDDEPIHTTAARRADLGRRALRRRRTSGVAALATAVVVTGAGLINLANLPSTGDGASGPATGGTTPSASTPTPSSLDATPAKVLSPPAAERFTEQCRASESVSEDVKRRFFNDGGARLMATATSRSVTAGVYASADGTMWGSCVSGNAGPAATRLAVFAAERSRSALVPGSSIDEICPSESECYRVELVANQLVGVDAIRWRFSESDRVATVHTNQGWFVLLNAVPVSTATPNGNMDVEYYDASGTRLAWANMRGASADPGPEHFPSLSRRPEQSLGSP